MTKTILVLFVITMFKTFVVQADLYEIYRIQNQLKNSYNDIEKLQTRYKNKIQEAVNMDKELIMQDLKAKVNEELTKCREEKAAYEVLNKIYAEQISELQNKSNIDQIQSINRQLEEALATILSYTTIINDQSKELSILKDDLMAKSQIILNMQTKAQDIADRLKYLEVRETQTQTNSNSKSKSESESGLELQLELVSVASSCQEFGNSSEIHLIKVDEQDAFPVPCNSQLAGPGWIVVQRRLNGAVKFYRNWLEYKEGFGNLSGEFFIGLEKLHRMSNAKPHELFIHLTDFNNESSHAYYDNILIAGENEDYTLQELGEYSGNAGDSMRDNQHQKFTTFDRDNDASEFNCAQNCLGGWWYNNCGLSNLNGQYTQQDDYYDNSEHGIYWDEWQGPGYTLQSVQIMIRPKMDTEK